MTAKGAHTSSRRNVNKLRGSVDFQDDKHGVFGVCFYRFISENVAMFIDVGERKNADSWGVDAPRLPRNKASALLPVALFQNSYQHTTQACHIAVSCFVEKKKSPK